MRELLEDARDDALARSALVRSRALRDVATSERVGVLRARIREAAEALRAHPRDEKLYRALDWQRENG